MRTPNTQTNNCKKFFLLCLLFFFAFPKINAQDEAIAKKAIITDFRNNFYKGNLTIGGRSFTTNTYGEVSGNFKESDLIKIDGYEITKPPKIFTNVLRITIKPIPKLTTPSPVEISSETKKLKDEIALLKKQLTEENNQHQLRIRLYDNTVADLNKSIVEKEEFIEKKDKREHYLEDLLMQKGIEFKKEEETAAETISRKDSLLKLQRKVSSEVRKRFELEKAKTEKLKLENVNKDLQNKIFLYFSIIIFLGAISAVVIAYSYRKARKKERESRLKSELYAQELQEKSEALARQAKELHQLNEETTTQKDKLSETSNRLLELLDEMQMQKDDLEKALQKLHKVQEF